MSIASQAKSFLSDLLDNDSELQQEIDASAAAPAEPDEQWIVYYKGEMPDCVWSYSHKPDDGIPFARLEGYWDEDKDNKVSMHFVPHRSKNLKLMDWDTFMENVVPNKGCTKIFDSEADFILEMI